MTDDTERVATATVSQPAHRPSRRAPLAWALRGAGFWLAVGAGQLAWLALAPQTPVWPHAAVAAGSVVGAVVSIAVAPVWRYRVHRWQLGAQAVYTRTGWLTQQWRIAPLDRVQTVDTYRGVLDRICGLANVTVTTASSAGAVRIVALDADDADRVAARLAAGAARGAGDAT